MTTAGLEVPDGYTVGDLTTADLAAAAVERLLERPDPPTALITAQNLITIGGVRALHRLGRQAEIALVGFDDLPLAELLTPGITVIAQDPGAIGRVAAERLFARLDDDSGPAETITVPARLITRGSGELQAPELAPIGRGSPAPAS